MQDACQCKNLWKIRPPTTKLVKSSALDQVWLQTFEDLANSPAKPHRVENFLSSKIWQET